jgi:hypothetical protein
MQPEALLPDSQQPENIYCPKPHESSLGPPIIFKFHFNIIIHYKPSFPSEHFLSVFSTKTLNAFLLKLIIVALNCRQTGKVIAGKYIF